MLKAVFFDLDDTLCDDASAWITCARKASELGKQFDPKIDVSLLQDTFLAISEAYWVSVEATRETRPIFEVRKVQWKQALEFLNYDSDDIQAQRLASDYGKRRSTEIELFTDVVPTLELLRQRGLLLALITNGLQMTHLEKVEHLGLQAYFDYIVIADAIGHFKPDALIFQHALKLCRCGSDEAVMVGDNIVNDIGGAEAAAIKAIWFNPDGKKKPLGAVAPSGGEIAAIGDLLKIL